MADIRRTLISVEIQDGTRYLDRRVLFADKIRLEKTARNNKWDITRDEFTVQAFLAWAVLNREGEISDTYETFLEKVADISFTADANETAEGFAGE